MEPKKENLIILYWVLGEKEGEKLQLSKLLDIESNNAINWSELYTLFNEHSILPLTADCISYIPNEYSSLKKSWKESIYSNIYIYSRLLKRQEQLLNAFQKGNISVVVLKGTSAAQYYSKPELRTMGDIDLLVKPQDYQKAAYCLINTGCKEVTTTAEIERGRHRSFHYQDVTVELHYYFSSRAIRDKADIFDSLLFNAIPEDGSVLPDEENGLVLLAHIAQHLGVGIGLRQIIDWMMFAKACLNDEAWYSSFQKKVQITGLEALAMTVTKMCQIYFGLTNKNITWCEKIDKSLCENLIQYVLECGNFGRKRKTTISSVSVDRIPSLKNPIQFFKYIQSHGENNWKAVKKHLWLKPFAWVYQLFHYYNMVTQNRIGTKKLKEIYEEKQKQNKLFSSLGIK